ncbi:MAG: flavodoxin [Candidatus Promineofilum sp.]|nr:flavodoxin [Promineifilum sp.]
MKIGLFYGSSTGNTQMDANIIKERFDEHTPGLVEIFDIAKVEVEAMLPYDDLILGAPTWNIGQLQDDWDIKFEQLDRLDLTGKRVAIYAPGDPVGYPDNYCDAMGMLGRKVEERGAELVGFTDASDYNFSHSLAVEDGVFLGLPLDDDNEPGLTEDRIRDWVAQLVVDFGVDELVAA